VERALLPAALTLVLGELSRKERSDEAGQFVGKRAGRAAAVAQVRSKATPAAHVGRTLLSANRVQQKQTLRLPQCQHQSLVFCSQGELSCKER
jgi:hypothetical protein